jgi:hypothetical protein
MAPGRSSTHRAADDRERVGSGISSGALWSLAGLIALGVAARGLRINESLWYDEIAAWMTTGVRGPWIIITTYPDPSNHILHTLLSWASVAALEPIVGQALALRWPALLFSLLSIPMVFAVARAAGRSTRGSMLAAGLMAVMPIAVLEGVEARGYSMMIFFSAAMMWAWLRLNDTRGGRWRDALAYAIAAALGAWTHPMTAFVMAGHALALALNFAWGERDRRGMRSALALAAGAALTIALYLPVIDEMAALRAMLRTSSTDQPALWGEEGRHLLMQLGGAWTWWAAAPGGALALIGLAVSAREPAMRRALWAACLGLLIAVVVIAITQSWVYARFLLFILPAVALAMALALSHLWRLNRWLGLAAGIIIALAWVGDLAARPPKQPLREASEFVRARQRGRGESVLVVGLAHPVNDAYGHGLSLHYSFMHGVEIDAHLALFKPEWIILYYPNHVSGATYARIEEAGFAEAARFHGWVDWTNGDVIVYRRGRF